MALVETGVAGVSPAAHTSWSIKTAQTKLLLGLGDLTVVSLSAFAVGRAADPGEHWASALVIFLAANVFWLGRARLYTARFITRRADEVRRIVDACILTAATVAVGAFAFELSVGRWWVLGSSVLSAGALTLEREVVRRRYQRLRASGEIRRDVLMIGDNPESRQLEAMFDEDRSLGYHVVGRIDPQSSGEPQELVTKVLATARRTAASGVIVAATGIETRASNRLIRDLMDAGLHVELSSTLNDIAPSRLTVRPLGRFPVVYVEPRHRHGWRAAAKRTFDVVTASVACLFLAPVFAVVALLIKKGSDGPVLFKQSRVGQNGEPFDVFKFRTMVVDAEERMADLMEDNEGAGPLFKMRDDPRVTPIGRVLRRTSIDELPQLWNVVRGEMSLVGPRPALASEMAEWESDLYGRLRVKPGITGMWQVSGRSETSFEEYTRLDLYYVDNWSLVVDLAILAKTIPAVLKSDGAY
jgi:exopolysaccharide biosynthesis polyprenyl glycosylphosphotransferase